MPKTRRTARVTILVTPAIKQLAQRIAQALSDDEQRWTETDVWEQGIAAFSQTKNVKEALAKAAAEESKE